LCGYQWIKCNGSNAVASRFVYIQFEIYRLRCDWLSFAQHKIVQIVQGNGIEWRGHCHTRGTQSSCTTRCFRNESDTVYYFYKRFCRQLNHKWLVCKQNNNAKLDYFHWIGLLHGRLCCRSTAFARASIDSDWIVVGGGGVAGAECVDSRLVCCHFLLHFVFNVDWYALLFVLYVFCL